MKYEGRINEFQHAERNAGMLAPMATLIRNGKRHDDLLIRLLREVSDNLTDFTGLWFWTIE